MSHSGIHGYLRHVLIEKFAEVHKGEARQHKTLKASPYITLANIPLVKSDHTDNPKVNGWNVISVHDETWQDCGAGRKKCEPIIQSVPMDVVNCYSFPRLFA